MTPTTVRRLMIAGPAVAGLLTPSLLAAHADPQTLAAAEARPDPTLRPDTPLPAYPREARGKREAGVVRMTLCIEADGRVSKADLAQTRGFPNLDNAVLKWANGIRFNPAMKGATPVTLCDFPMTYAFRVTKGPTQQQQTNNAFDAGPATALASGP